MEMDQECLHILCEPLVDNFPYSKK